MGVIKILENVYTEWPTYAAKIQLIISVKDTILEEY